jgi:hypothetical protein
MMVHLNLADGREYRDGPTRGNPSWASQRGAYGHAYDLAKEAFGLLGARLGIDPDFTAAEWPHYSDACFDRGEAIDPAEWLTNAQASAVDALARDYRAATEALTAAEETLRDIDPRLSHDAATVRTQTSDAWNTCVCADTLYREYMRLSRAAYEASESAHSAYVASDLFTGALAYSEADTAFQDAAEALVALAARIDAA